MVTARAVAAADVTSIRSTTMTRDAAMLLAMTLVAASWLVVHVRLLTRTLRSPQLSHLWRALSIVPPCTPIAAWRVGRRGLCVVWVAHGLVYGLLNRFA